MELQGSILIVDDDEDILVAGKLLLKRHFASVQICNRPEHIPTLMAQNSFDAILLDMNFGPGESSGQQGFDWLGKIVELDPQMVVIMITAHGGIDLAVDAMKLGATDFIAKPWHNEKLVATLSTACQLGQTRKEASNLKTTNKVLTEVISTSENQAIIGSSNQMQQVMSLVEKAAPTEANVLILGENGTGKELIARSLHQSSHRANKVFMSIDLGAVAEHLFESELFGHKKGAFTDAREDRIGKLQAAQGGTLFLDEVGNLPLHLQTKLLTVLEQRKVTPLGANEAVAIDVRVISATNLATELLHSEQRFRQDLLFRLNTVEIKLPALHERTQDIVPIAHHYADLYCKKYNKPVLRLSEQAIKAIEQYSWPGNVRALKHAIERAVILAEGDALETSDFQLEQIPKSSFHKENNQTYLDESAPELVNEDLNLERIEKQAIQQALRKHKYNVSHTAKELGLTRAALYRRMEKHGL